MKRYAVLATLVLLAAAPATARAGELVRMNNPGGLLVQAEDDNREDFTLRGILTPEGTVASWDAGFSGTCLISCTRTDDPGHCSMPIRDVVDCTRTASGVTIQVRGGDDDLDVFDVGGDPFSIDMGDGDDRVDRSGATFGGDNHPAGGATGPWNAALGAGDDLYEGSLGADTVNAGSGDDSVRTLEGNDFVQGLAGNDVIDPGPGSDGVSAGDGNDRVVAGAEAERAETDSYDGGAGFDTLDYSLRTTPIFAAKIGTTGGAGGEDDGIANFERILGGSGNDSILGFSSNGGPGNDVLTGGDGGDTIVGGTGADTIRGFAGNDTLDANDGVADTKIECSTGFDTVFLDLKDPNPNDAVNCESIDRRKVDEEPGTRILSAGARVRGGRAAVRLLCPRAVHRACAGRLTLGLRHSASARYRIAAGHSGVVAVAVNAADAARAHRAAHGLTAVARSRERGLKGAETVIRRLTLRA
jgi:hypothetical protein